MSSKVLIVLYQVDNAPCLAYDNTKYCKIEQLSINNTFGRSFSHNVKVGYELAKCAGKLCKIKYFL